MGKIVKQSIAGTIFSYIGIALGFLTTIINPRIFTPEQNGLFKVILSYSGIFAIFASLGFNSASYRLFSFFRNTETKHNGFNALSLLINFAGFIVSVVVFILLYDTIVQEFTEKYASVVWILLPLIFFNQYYSQLDSSFTVLYRSVIGTVVKEVVQRVLMFLPILLYYLNLLNFTEFVYWYIAVNCLPAVILFVRMIQIGEFDFNLRLAFISKELRKTIIEMSFFGIIAGFASYVIQYIDGIMLNNMLGLENVGIFSITMYFGTVISKPTVAIRKISSTIIADAWKANDIKMISTIYKKSSLTQFIIAVFVFVGIWANINNVFHILPKEYETGKYVIFFIALGNVIEMSAGVSSVVISNSKYYKMLTYMTVIFIIAVVGFNLLFIPYFNMIGAALASIAATIVYVLLRYFYVWKICGCQPYNYKFLLVLIVGGFAYLASWLLPEIKVHFILDLLIRSSIVSIIYLSGVYILNISEDINNLINKSIEIAKQKLKR